MGAAGAGGPRPSIAPERGNDGELSGSLRIGIAPVVMSIVALLTTPYSELHPDVSLTVLAKNVPEIERSLRGFEIDVTGIIEYRGGLETLKR